MMDSNDHSQDSDCNVDPDIDTCRECGVLHGTPCDECGGRAFHRPGCVTSDGELYGYFDYGQKPTVRKSSEPNADANTGIYRAGLASPVYSFGLPKAVVEKRAYVTKVSSLELSKEELVQALKVAGYDIDGPASLEAMVVRTGPAMDDSGDRVDYTTRENRVESIRLAWKSTVDCTPESKS
jgi:hypothetical protein